MQIKTTMRYHFRQARMAIINKSTNKCWGGCGENNYKGHMDKTKVGGGSKRGRWVGLGWGGVVGGKCRQL